MSAIVNDRDLLLQATSPRLLPVTLPDSIYMPAVKGVQLTSSGTNFQVTSAGAASPSNFVITATLKQITGTVAFTVTSGSATLTGTGNTRTLTYSGSTFPVTVHAAVTDTDGTVYTADLSFTKVVDGTSGSTAKLLSIISDSQVFQIAKDGTVTPSTITLTLNQQNLAGSPTFTVTSGTATLSGTGSSRTLSYANLSTDTATIQVSQDGLTDTVTLVKLREGTDSIVGFLTNEAQTIPATSAGVVTSADFGGAAGTFKVYKGITDVTASASFSFAAFGNPDGVTASIGSTNGAYSVTGAGTWANSSNVTVVTFQAAYGGVTLQKVFTVTKSRQGVAGADSTSYWMTRSAAAIVKNADGTYASATILFAALAQTGTSAPAAYSGRFLVATSTDGTNYTTQYTTANTTNESSKTYTIPAGVVAVKAQLYRAESSGVAASVLLDESITYVVTAGTHAITPIISNDSTTLPASSSGAVTSYSGSGTDIQMWEGTNALTYITSGTPAAGQWTISSSTISPSTSITLGAITAIGTPATIARVSDYSSMNANTSLITVTFAISLKRSDGTVMSFNVVQAIAKASAGLRGSLSANGLDYGIRAPNSQWDDNSANRVIENRATGSTLTTGIAAGSMTAPGLRIGDEVTLANGAPWTATKGAWSSATAYSKNDYVVASNVVYRALQDSTNQTPSSTSQYWLVIGTSTDRTTWVANTVYNQYDRLTDSGTVYFTLWPKHTSTASVTFAAEQLTPNVAITRYWTGGAWGDYAQVYDGNLLVRGSVSADKLYVNFLSAIVAHLGTVDIDAGGYLRGGQTDYDTGTGFFLGHTSTGAGGTAYKFSIGSHTGPALLWNGTQFLIRSASGNQRIEIDSSQNMLLGYDSSGNVTFRVGGTLGSGYFSSVTSIMPALFATGTDTPALVGAGTGTGGVNSSLANGVKGQSDYAEGVYGIGTVSGGAAHGVRGKNTAAAGAGTGWGSAPENTAGTGSTSVGGVIGSANGYDFYADGNGQNYGPFTGTHDCLVPNGVTLQPGQIVVDVEVMERNGWSSTVTRVETSSQAYQEGVLGVICADGRPLRYSKPAVFIDAWLDGSTQPTMKASYEAMQDAYWVYAANALGEGQMQVTGEGGDITKGCFIVTSSTPGVGMRQSDNIYRTYTVAKARESVTFSDPSEIKIIACTYHSA